jgi:hypothetical protein
MRFGGQFQAPWFPDEEQTATFLTLLPRTVIIDTARITEGLHQPLTQWLHDGKPNTLRVYHADQEATNFMHTLGIKFKDDTEPATYTILLAHPQRNWKYHVRPSQPLSPVARNETTREVLRMGFHGLYYQIDRKPIVRFNALWPELRVTLGGPQRRVGRLDAVKCPPVPFASSSPGSHIVGICIDRISLSFHF